MIGRRAFVQGLGSLMLATPAMAEVRANGKVVPNGKKKKPLKDIPIVPFEQIPNHRQFMRDIVIELSAYGKARVPGFIILPRNAPELLIKEKREYELETGHDPDGASLGKYPEVGSVIRPYLKAIDGLFIDGAFYGGDIFDQPTSAETAKPLLQAAEALRREGRVALTVEYCNSKPAVTAASKAAAAAKTLTYIDQDGDKTLGHIPRIHPATENPAHATDLSGAKNFLPILHSEDFLSRSDWVRAMAETNYDLLIVDPFWRGADPLTFDDIKSLRYKKLGTRRLILARLPLGRARDTAYYWKREWSVGNPPWLFTPDPDDPAQTLVEYWSPEWKELLGKFMEALVNLGVDGVLLDYVDAYLPFEDMMPL